MHKRGFLGGSVVKNLPVPEMRVQFLGWEHPLEKEMATHSSILAWRIPGMGETGGLPSMESHRVGHDWSDLAAAAVDLVFRQNLPLGYSPLEALLNESFKDISVNPQTCVQSLTLWWHWGVIISHHYNTSNTYNACHSDLLLTYK